MSRTLEAIAISEFGVRLRTARLAVGMTQAQLAEKAGLSRASIGNIEHAKSGTTYARAAMLMRIVGQKVQFVTCNSGREFNAK